VQLRKLLASLADCPVPAELGVSPANLRMEVSRAANTLLQAKLSALQQPIASEQAKRLRAYATWLESLAVLAPGDEVDTATAFYVSSSIQEFLLADLELGEEPRAVLPLIGSALLAAASNHPAIGAIFGQRSAGILCKTGVTSLLTSCLASLASFAGCQLTDAIEAHRRAEKLSQAVDLATMSVEEIAELDGLLMMARASAEMAWAILYGEDSLAAHAKDTVLAALQHWNEKTGGTSLTRWLATRWVRAAEALWMRCTQRVLPRLGFEPPYLERLVSDGIVTLWPQQLEALEAYILDAPQFVLGMPTGAGKTLLAELVVVRTMGEQPEGWTCYIAPSRALVAQMEREFSRRLRPLGITVRSVLAGPEESDLLDQEIEQLTSPRTLTITTPEKLESYHRIYPDSFQGLVLLVVDEAHLLGEAPRGLLLEETIARIRVQHPRTKVVLLSAVASNVDELATWLGNDAKSYATSLRLNRQQFGVAVKLESDPDVIREYVRDNQRRRLARYQGGIVTDGDLEESLRTSQRPVPVAASQVFQIKLRERLDEADWVELKKETGATDHARQLALRFHRSGDTTLVFCPQRAAAVKQAKTLSDELGDVKFLPERRELASAMVQCLGGDHPLPNLVQRGVAYHHAQLPPLVQRLIEYAVRERLILTLFTTTTLREGMNLPANNVIVAGEKRFDEESGRTTDMDVSDFFNMAGRAGRPNLDTQGVAILVPNQLARAVPVARKYFLIGPDVLAVKSAMVRLIMAIEQAKAHEDLHNLSPADQSLLLSLYSTGIRNAAGFRQVFERTLLYTQSEFDLNEVSTFCDRAFRKLESDIGEETALLVAKLGFGLDGSMTVTNFVTQHLDDLSSPGSSVTFGEADTLALAELCLEGCHEIPELRIRTLRPESLWSSGRLKDLVFAWVNGSPYTSLAAMVDNKIDWEKAVSKAVELSGDVSQWLPWGLGAIQYVVSAMGRQPNRFVSHFPLYVRFGVPNRVAALLSLIGVFDRQAAIELAGHCKIVDPTLEEIEEWYEEINLQKLLGADPRLPVLQKRRASLRLARVRARWTSARAAVVGMPCMVEEADGRFNALSLSKEILGSLEPSEELSSRFGHGRTNLFGVVANADAEPLILVTDIGPK